MAIRFSVQPITKSRLSGDVLIVPVASDVHVPDVFSDVATKSITKRIKQVAFAGAWGAAEVFVAPEDVNAEFVALAGIGDADASLDRQMEGLRRGVGIIMRDIRKHMLRDVVCVLDSDMDSDVAAGFAGACYESVALSDYRFVTHKPSLAKEQKNRSVRSVRVLVKRSSVDAVKEELAYTESVMEGVTLTRDLVNQPASHAAPRVLVDRARAIAKSSARLNVRVLNKKQAEKQNFNAFLAVARGSTEEPYVIHLTYKPRKKAKKKIVFVGKGITFDSGGLSLKPGNFMEDMKLDMAGAATVLGLFSILSSLDVDVEVHGIIAACENMPSGNAYRPGDVLTAKNGKTIEVINTDAEGRVTMADALTYAEEQKPDMIVDLATLTGACIAAVGSTYSALWSTDKDLQESLLEAARDAGEGIVAFPLTDELRPTIESKVADVRNAATVKSGGAITAALFLREFVQDTPWAHLDIAGPVFSERSLLPYYSYGGTGYGVRTLANFLTDIEGASS